VKLFLKNRIAIEKGGSTSVKNEVREEWIKNTKLNFKGFPEKIEKLRSKASLTG
jgi:hypothetical protein